MDVGFIGLGNMGRPMAENLLAAGHRLFACNRSPGPAEALARRGAEIVSAPGDACRAEVVITMLADDESVEAMSLGPGGVAEALDPDALHVCMSTISPDLAKRLAAVHRERGQHYVSAPVLGRPEAATAAKIFIVAAGEETAIGRCRPLFDAMAQRIFVAGDEPWMANLVKVCNNFLVTAAIEAMAEAFALVRKGGIDPQCLHEVLCEAMFPGPIYRIYGAMIAGDHYESAGFRFSLGLKDASLTLEAGERLGVPLPVGSAIHDRFVAGLERGYDNLDWGALGRVAADEAGLESDD